MKHIFFLFILVIPVFAFAQFPANPRKMVIGYQTTADGIIYRASGAPSYTPSTANDARVYINTDNGDTYVYNGLWEVLGFRRDEPILRVPIVGDTIKGFSWYYFTPPTWASPTLSPTTQTYEVGTSNSITISGTISNPSSTTLSNGTLRRFFPLPDASIDAFGATSSYSLGITFTPQQGGSGSYNELRYSFYVDQDFTGTESGTATSTTKTIEAVYPVFYGMASTDTTTVKGAIYSTLTKSVTAEDDKSFDFTGTGLIYYAFPASWGDTNLSSITDPNGFDVTASFTRTTATVTSTGLTNNYTAVSYIVYYLNTGTTTTSASTYTFNQ